MRIVELDWLVDHRDTLSNDDRKEIDKLEILNQYKLGTIDMKGHKVIESLNQYLEIYHKYNSK